MLVLGDLNINILDFNNLHDYYNTTMANYGFESLVNELSRLASSTCIDHVYARIIDKNAIAIEVDISDHSMTVTSSSVIGKANKCAISQYNQVRLDYTTLNILPDDMDWADFYQLTDAFDALMFSKIDCCS